MKSQGDKVLRLYQLNLSANECDLVHEEELTAEFKVTREALLSMENLRPLQLDVLTETNYSISEAPTMGQDEEEIGSERT